jgi:cytoplasmic tRNA 2-thiolation protein 1
MFYHFGYYFRVYSMDFVFQGYRDDSLETVKQNRDEYEMPLKILSYEELYGWTMDAIVKQVC